MLQCLVRRQQKQFPYLTILSPRSSTRAWFTRLLLPTLPGHVRAALNRKHVLKSVAVVKSHGVRKALAGPVPALQEGRSGALVVLPLLHDHRITPKKSTRKCIVVHCVAFFLNWFVRIVFWLLTISRLRVIKPKVFSISLPNLICKM